ncbi:MAG TPA: type II toxin-antitoxin system prevent-host-death family antitoxin [Acidothermaceae bacterium]
MTTTGLRELRQQASELVRQAEAGQTVTITVSGREVAELGPIRRHRWRRGSDIGEVFRGPSDDDWAADRDAIAQTVVDPFTR